MRERGKAGAGWNGWILYPIKTFHLGKKDTFKGFNLLKNGMLLEPLKLVRNSKL